MKYCMKDGMKSIRKCGRYIHSGIVHNGTLSSPRRWARVNSPEDRGQVKAPVQARRLYCVHSAVQ